MRCVTWTRDSHGLFDYESKSISKKNIKTHTGGKIILKGDDVHLVSRNHECNVEERQILRLERNHDKKFVLRNATVNEVDEDDMSEGSQNMLTVVRNTKSTPNNLDYQLSQGDTMKLGRLKFRVKNVNSPQIFAEKWT